MERLELVRLLLGWYFSLSEGEKQSVMAQAWIVRRERMRREKCPYPNPLPEGEGTPGAEKLREGAERAA